MSKKMLIDAGHREETRVVVVDGSKVEDFDFEAEARRPIRGNIYLAKVTRVEPSLQAAFVEYGGNRHGFLAFNEIHPDYYQIPYEDRMALAEEEASAVQEDAEDDVAESEDAAEANADAADTAAADGEEAPEAPETIGDDSEDDMDDAQAARRRRQLYRKYKIQEVIKRRQILLVQVAKEERGNKGAALTTYLSLAGRYCVLMPNTPRGGGISRKISNASDRKRLKGVVNELELPKGVGLIIRTAGASRTKTEIKRDADYLLRLWENIRALTLKSVAPSLIYEEGNLVKRVIRDLYDKEIDSVLVEGEEAYKEAKAFMKMLMPSHAKKVQHYKETVPLFLRFQVEAQLEAIYSPIAPLKSGGYLVINPTEALVSIDVNSGRATRERNIEATALRTNLEAAAEAARQMRLRDLAGLVVIDFIDMDENKNNRAVEKKMKDVLKRDRARLQMGRISQFGLMEISRQRRRTSLLEGSTTPCPTCRGTGHLRSTESSALVALRGLEREGTRGKSKRVRISVPTDVAIYLLNDKRDHLMQIEERFSMRIIVAADDSILAPEFTIEALESREPGEELQIAPLSVESIEEISIPDEDETTASEDDEPREGTGRRRRRRRRRKSGGSEDAPASMDVISVDDEESGDSAEASDESSEDGEDQPRRRRRRGRRGGRGRRRNENQAETGNEDTGEESGEDTAEAGAEPVEAKADAPAVEPAADAEPAVEAEAEEKPKPKRRTRRKKADVEAEAEAKTDEAPAAEAEAPAETAAEDEKPKRRTRRPRKKAEAEPAAETVEAEAKTEAEPVAEAEAEEKPKPKRRTRRKKEEPKADAEAPAEAPAETPAEAPVEAAAEETPAEATETPAEDRETETAGAGDDDGRPKRRGWWNRTGLFGGN
ncbi:Rne/Rng family ribonuclease [Maricaulis parjimensis]|uniref:Rne/Rng family ribonuclease n=1 Tax=Maricaulis parjimensis TaxID=144023 RepID=UPI00193A3907|nr:Rne/Rng family ribonuclease [Maricaulis parjimensis]